MYYSVYPLILSINLGSARKHKMVNKGLETGMK